MNLKKAIKLAMRLHRRNSLERFYIVYDIFYIRLEEYSAGAFDLIPFICGVESIFNECRPDQEATRFDLSYTQLYEWENWRLYREAVQSKKLEEVKEEGQDETKESD